MSVGFWESLSCVPLFLHCTLFLSISIEYYLCPYTSVSLYLYSTVFFLSLRLLFMHTIAPAAVVTSITTNTIITASVAYLTNTTSTITIITAAVVTSITTSNFITASVVTATTTSMPFFIRGLNNCRDEWHSGV